MALHLAVTQQTVSNWESGASKVPDRHRRLLADILDISLADLQGWISADEETRHKATRRELSETVKVLERFVNQYQELGHTYRRLDETSEKMLGILQKLSDQQNEILKVLKGLAEN